MRGQSGSSARKQAATTAITSSKLPSRMVPMGVSW
jgi:hypothetical protein